MQGFFIYGFMYFILKSPIYMLGIPKLQRVDLNFRKK